MTDRPWGQTLGALGLRKLTGQLTVQAEDGKDYCVAFERGAVVGASSLLASDSAARVALTNHLIMSSQVTEIARRLAAQPERDEIEVLGEACRLTPDQVLRLRQRVIAQRAARTFSIDRGTFVVDDQIAVAISREAAVDIRAVVYLGVRMNLSEQRLAADLRLLGTHFVLKADAVEDLPQFGLTTSEHPILEALKAGTTLPALEATHRELDPRTARSVIYALVACFACDATTPAAAEPVPDDGEAFRPVAPRARTNPGADDGIYIKPRTTTLDRGEPVGPRTASGPRDLAARAVAPAMPRTSTTDPPIPRTLTNPGAGPARPRSPSDRPESTSYPVVRPRSPSESTPTMPRTSTLEARTRAPSISPAQPPSAPRATTPPATRPPSSPTAPPASRTATPATPTVGRTPSPNLPSSGRTPTPSIARTTSDRTKAPSEPRTVTPAAAQRPRSPSESRNAVSALLLDEPAPGVSGTFVLEEPSAEEKYDAKAVAAESYKRGQSALRDNQVELAIEELLKANELDPHDIDYQAMLAWAQFCGAVDKNRIADKTRKVLNHAIQKSKKPENPRLFLGRVERMLGRDREALRHFQEVLELQPRNADAAAEIRQIESRIASGSGEKPGLASLFNRKK